MVGLYIRRSLESVLIKALHEFPAVMLTGPRQSGKTTLLRHLLSESHGYVSLELPDVRAVAETDPRSFLERYPPPAVFDEVQHAPGLLPYVKERIDAHRDERGQYVLTGSQNLLVAERVTESLAGRVAVLRLLPLSHREEAGQTEAPLCWEGESGRPPRPESTHHALWRRLLRGHYPELVSQPGRDLDLWHGGYVQTYLERDVRSIRHIADLRAFQEFLQALAGRCGQLLNLTELSRDLGIAVNTVKAWLSVLEATYQVIILRPYFASIGKRLVKSPKVYFTDTGTLCHLTGLRDADHAASGPMAGAIFETAVLSELVKIITHRGRVPRLYFWRTAAGSEVDVIVDLGTQLIPIEAKTSTTPRPQMARGIEQFRRDFGERVGTGYVVHPGDLRLPLAPEVMAIPFADL